MNLYWLSRNGAAAEGPFAESQLLSMWLAGKFTALDQLCPDKSEDWMQASFVMRAIEAKTSRVQAPVMMPTTMIPRARSATPPQVKRARRMAYSQNSCLRLLLILFGIFGLFFFLIPGLILLGVAAMVPSGGWRCSECGNDLGSKSKLCGVCGSSLDPERTLLDDLGVVIVMVVIVVTGIGLYAAYSSSSGAASSQKPAPKKPGPSVTIPDPDLSTMNFERMARESGIQILAASRAHLIQGHTYHALRMKGSNGKELDILVGGNSNDKWTEIKDFIVICRATGATGAAEIRELEAMQAELH